ncbi:ATP-binding protein [Mucilaginibacter ginkgonis]|uniref:histidine kinase n=1 Tax=Mucilaginibacter ginkgonis TaxID=2682091 RepID=A0A6I4HY17_9SPHI|nr:ATP-binding protein [Mucilaginibacter ginkgonis]QQL49378.1 GAF domain-containing protein [Mucilaginibacter ginkgonis]
MREEESIQADIEAIGRIPAINAILEVVCRVTHMGFAVVVRVTKNKWVACAVHDEINFGLEIGSELKLDTTLCHEVRQSGQPIIIADVANDKVYAKHHTPAIYGLQSYIAVPVHRKNGEFFGTLCAIDPNPANIDNSETAAMFRLYADLISFNLAADDEVLHANASLQKERSKSNELKALSANLVNVNNQLIFSNKQLQQSEARLRMLYQELEVANEEISASNEELTSSRDELQLAYENLKEVTTNLNQAIDLALIDLWAVDLTTGIIAITSRSRDLHGVRHEQEISYQESLELVSPDFRDIVDETIKKAIEEKGSFTVEYTITPKDGRKVRWLKSTGQVYTNHLGVPVKMQGLMADITEQKEDEQRKSDFIGMVSHELKTPLTSLNGYIQLLQTRTGKYADSFLDSSLDKANRQIGKMTKMINGFLNVSRFESGKIHIDHQQFDMKDLLADIEEETVPANNTHRITFHPVESTVVNGDKDKIGQVITNFISNALKYSAPATHVQVACIAVDGNVQVSVADEGMGIAQKDIDKLFDRYYRVEGHQMHTVSGFGIGLYLCAEIVERHNGKIWVESEPGKGSSFYFSLPLS